MHHLQFVGLGQTAFGAWLIITSRSIAPLLGVAVSLETKDLLSNSVGGPEVVSVFFFFCAMLSIFAPCRWWMHILAMWP